MTLLPALCRILRGRMKYSIGFTNGCFDLLHEGHRHLLNTSRNYCDVLFVGVNSDKSVARLKGSCRPVEPLAVRVKNLEASSLCDAIIPFNDEAELLEVIMEISPEFLIKGADYKNTALTGESFVKSCGGQIIYIPLLPGHSTTKLLS